MSKNPDPLTTVAPTVAATATAYPIDLALTDGIVPLTDGTVASLPTAQAVALAQAVSIPRLYHYDSSNGNSDLLVFNEKFGDGIPNGFSQDLNRSHGVVDCFHDQFDAQRMNIFFKIQKSNERSLKELIWSYYIGDPSQPFKTNGNDYKMDNNIHKLSHALEIDDHAANTHITIQLPHRDPSVPSRGPSDNNKTIMNFKCEPWNDTTPPPPTSKLNSATVYKFIDYIPSTSYAAGRILRDRTNRPDINQHYILDCGSKTFHNAFVDKTQGGVSIFSGILDSSTTDDPVPIGDIKSSSSGLKKLQFRIPYIYHPDNGILYVQCKFQGDYLNDEESINTKVIELTFYDDKNNNYGMIEVEKHNVPNLPNVSDYLAGQHGCLNALKRLVTTNPCNYYINNLPDLFTDFDSSDDFKKMFMIAFKHMGDKIRLIDAIIINNILSGKCHTATIDTFSYKYSVLGNMHAILPIKVGKYLCFNNCHTITQQEIDDIKEMKENKAKEEKKALCAQIGMLLGNDYTNIYYVLELFCKEGGIFDIFNKRVTLKASKNTRRILPTSCLGIQYWFVDLNETIQIERHYKQFLNTIYDKDDYAKISTVETIMRELYNNLVHINQPLLASYCDDTTTSMSVVQRKILDILLNLDRMNTKMSFIGIKIENSGTALPTITSSTGKKIDLKLFTNIMSKCKYESIYTSDQHGGHPHDTDNDIANDILTKILEIYSDENILKDFKSYSTEYYYQEYEEDLKSQNRERKNREAQQRNKEINIEADFIEVTNGKHNLTIGRKRKRDDGQNGGDHYSDNAKKIIAYLKKQCDTYEKYCNFYFNLELELELEQETDGEWKKTTSEWETVKSEIIELYDEAEKIEDELEKQKQKTEAKEEADIFVNQILEKQILEEQINPDKIKCNLNNRKLKQITNNYARTIEKHRKEDEEIAKNKMKNLERKLKRLIRKSCKENEKPIRNRTKIKRNENLNKTKKKRVSEEAEDSLSSTNYDSPTDRIINITKRSLSANHNSKNKRTRRDHSASYNTIRRSYKGRGGKKTKKRRSRKRITRKKRNKKKDAL